MTGIKVGDLISVQRWHTHRMSAWERILLEDPLDPPEPAPPAADNYRVSEVTGANVITMSMGTMVTSANVTAVSKIRLTMSDGTVATLDNLDQFPSTMAPSQVGWQDQPAQEATSPWVRNRKDRLTRKSLGDKFYATVRRAEAVIGQRRKASDIHVWNDRFWEYVQRVSVNERPSSRRDTSRRPPYAR